MKKQHEEDEFNKISVFCCGRTIYFFDDVTNHTVAEMFKILQILESNSKKKPIKIVIHSRGGDIYSGLALFDRIKISPCKITTVGTGFVASMGLIIFLAGKERVITPTTVLLNHQNFLEMSGRTEDIKIEAKENQRLETLTANLVANVTKLSLQKIKEDIQKGDKYITPAEAISQGYAHKMINYNAPIKRKR